VLLSPGKTPSGIQIRGHLRRLVSRIRRHWPQTQITIRLILHTAAYWLMLTVRDAIPKAHALATAEFATIRLRLLKLGARVIEMASRVRLAFAAACPDATLIRHVAAALMPTGP
jgi:hypothetical protein